jgi:SHS2 domain-containing protein
VSVEYLDHTADVGLRACGPTLEEAFCEAARGLFALMVNVGVVASRARHGVRATAQTLPELLVEWLSDLLAQKDLTGMVFGRFEVRIRDTVDGHVLDGTAWGEEMDRARHGLKLEVKGISYLGLVVEQEAEAWVAQCVLDV